MREIGLSLPNRGVLFGATSTEELVELAERADESGAFGSVWVGDGLIAKPRLEAVVTLSALAATTRTVKLGVCCMATFPIRNPVLFACQWASLDVISGGRTLLAVCSGAPTERSGGNYEAELETAGIAGRERFGRLVEGVEILRKVWAGETSHDGRFWQWSAIDLLPKPLQQPCPIWIASNPNPDLLSEQGYERAITRVAVHGDGWLTTVATPSRFARLYSDIRTAAANIGREHEMQSALHLMINLGPHEEDARDEAKRFLDTYYGMNTKTETMEAWGAYGEPERVADRIAEYLESGLDLPILRFAAYNQNAQFECAIDKLLPRIYDAVPRT